jgi:hypothetical protein
MGAFRAIAYGILMALVAAPVHAQTAAYHLHKEASMTAGLFQLKTAGPDAGAATIPSSDLKNQPPAEYLIKAFNTQTGVPNAGGTIPAASVVIVTLWIRKTASSGVLYPRAKLSLNAAAGPALCTATGSTALTTTITRHSLSCTTSTEVPMTAADRFYLWVGVNVASGSGTASVKGELHIEGKLNGNYDSQLVTPLPIATPTISGVSPSSGPVGTVVTISGSNFGTTQGSSSVRFNGVTAAPTNWTATSITAPVPPGATSGNVSVTVNGLASNGVSFAVPPAIANLSRTSGSVGAAVIISGTTFGTAQGSSTVTFNGMAATPTSWSPTSITAPVPAGATTGPLVVRVSGLASNGSMFTLLTPPVIASLSPSSGPPGALVHISGTDFGAIRGGSTVSFDGVPAAPFSWTDDLIVARAPGSALAFTARGHAVIRDGSFLDPTRDFTRVLQVRYDSVPSGAERATLFLGANDSGWTTPYLWLGSTGDASDLYCAVDTGGGSVDSVPVAAALHQWHTVAVVYTASVHELRVYFNLALIATLPADFGNVPPFAVDKLGSDPAGDSWSGLAFAYERTWQAALTVTELRAEALVTSAARTIGLLSNSPLSGLWDLSDRSGNGHDWTAVGALSQTIGPFGRATASVVVTVGGLASNAMPFAVRVPPRITSVTPSSGPIGSVVTINGFSFGTTQGSSMVAFEGVAASGVATSWSDTSIEFMPLLAAANGSIVVSVDGLVSNAAPLTVTSIGAESGQIASLPFVDAPALVTSGDAASYGFAPAITGWYRFSTKGTTWDTSIEVFAGADTDRPTPVAFNDDFLDADGTPRHWSQVDVKLTADVPYVVKVQIAGGGGPDNQVSFKVSPLKVGRDKIIVQSTETGTWVYDDSASPIRKIGFQLPGQRPPSSYEYVRGLAATKDGLLWISSSGQRLRLVDPSSGSVLATLAGISPSGYNYNLREHPPSGDILVASYDALERYTRAGALVTTYGLAPAGRIGMDVTPDGHTLFYLQGTAIKRWDLENDQALNDYKEFGNDVPDYFALDGSGGVVAMWVSGSGRYGVDANNSAARFNANGDQIGAYVNPAAGETSSDEGGVAVDPVAKRVWIHGGVADDSSGPGAALLQFDLDTGSFLNLTPTMNQRFDVGDTGVDEWYDNNAGQIVLLPDPPCAVSLSSSWSSWPADGGQGFVTLSSPPGCQWTASTDVAWLTPTADPGSGPGSVGYGVAPNTTGQPRTGTITIGGARVQVYQTATFLGGGDPGGLPSDQYTTVSADVTVRGGWVDASGQLMSTPPPIQYHWERSRRTGPWKTAISGVSLIQKPMGSLTGPVLPPDRIAGMRIEDDEDGSPIRVYTASGATYSLPAGTDSGTVPTQFNASWIDKFVASSSDANARRQALQQALGSAVDQVGGWDRFIGYAGTEMSEFLVDPQSSVIVQVNVVRDGQLASQTSFVYEPVSQGPLLLRGIHGEHLMSAETGTRSITDIEYLNLRIE